MNYNKENSEFDKITKITKDSQTKPESSKQTEVSIETTTGYPHNRRNKKKKANPNSFKYTVFICLLWIIFLAFLISGSIVHVEDANNINAATILWSLSFVVLIISVLYTYLYIKARSAQTKEQKLKLLKYLPL
jgi:hypothetical protein